MSSVSSYLQQRAMPVTFFKLHFFSFFLFICFALSKDEHIDLCINAWLEFALPRNVNVTLKARIFLFKESSF